MNKKNQKGAALLPAVIIILSVSLIVGFSLVFLSVDTFASNQNRVNSVKSYYVAQGAIEDSLLKLNKLMNFPETNILNVGNSSVNISKTENADGTITVSAEAWTNNRVRKLEIDCYLSSEKASFFYGVQAGEGGFVIEGGSTINGNVYSNGDIVGTSGTITGSAIAATVSVPAIDQINMPVFPPTGEIRFGGNGLPQDLTQSFQVSSSEVVSSVLLYMKRSTSGWMNSITARVTTDGGGRPSGTVLATASVNYQNIQTSFNYVTLLFSSLSLTPGQTYWLVLDTGTTWGAYYTIGASQGGYGNGSAKTGSWSSGGGIWNDTVPAGLDAYFQINIGGQTSKIIGSSGSWHLSVGTLDGDAWAHEVSRTTVGGDIYCQIGENNASGKTCDMSRPDPEPIDMPISQSQIDNWQQTAESGEIFYGNYDVNWQGATLGPIKITGDLSVSGGGTLLVTGPIWVEGKINVGGGGRVRLDPSYGPNSEAIIADGIINLAGDAQFFGSGTQGSYPIILSTSSCPESINCNGSPALYITGGSGAIVLAAPNGTLELNGGSAARSLGAYKIKISGGGSVNYEEGLANLGFSSGPGGGFQVISWKEVE